MDITQYTLPLPPKPWRISFGSTKIEPRKIHVVIPVYEDWSGLKITLDSLQQLSPQPGAITVVNDNTGDTVPEWLDNYSVKIVNYEGNKGPAYARNKGCENLDPEFEWIYFTDCGCQHVKNIIIHFINTLNKQDHPIVAVCGNVSGKGTGIINRFMTERRILNPPFENYQGPNGELVPQSLITANALVYAPAFYKVGGFSTDFQEAGGEDLDLGIRLRNLGALVYESNAMVIHKFEEDIKIFKKRFERYGRGNWLLEQKHQLPSLRPQSYLIENEEFLGLAKLQTESMCKGYDHAKENSPVKENFQHLSIEKNVDSAKWHLPKGTKTRLGEGKINAISNSPDGNRRVVATSVGVSLYDTHTDIKLERLTGHTANVTTLAFSPDSFTLATGGEDKTVRIWDTYTGIHRYTLEKHKENITSLAFSPDGNMLASGSSDGTIWLWDVYTGSHKSKISLVREEENSVSVTSLAYSPDGSKLISGSSNGTIRLWETEIRFGKNRCINTNMEDMGPFTEYESSVTSLVFNSTGNLLACKAKNGIIEVWKIDSTQDFGRKIKTLESVPSENQESSKDSVDTTLTPSSLVFSPDSRTLVSGSIDGVIHVWDTADWDHFDALKGHSSAVLSLVYGNDGTSLNSMSEDGTILAWNTMNGKNRTTLIGHPTSIESVEFSLNGRILVDRGNNGQSKNDSLYLWDMDTYMPKAKFTAESYDIKSAKLSPDSRTLVIRDNTNKVHLWDIETCIPKATITEELKDTNSFIFSHDSRIVANWNNDTINLWNVETAEHKATLTDGLSGIESVTFSPNSSTLISRSGASESKNINREENANIINFWDVETGNCKSTPTKDLENIKSVKFSPDNRTLMIHSYSREKEVIHIWDIETRKHRVSITDGLDNVKSVVCTPDNCTLVTLGKDKTDSYHRNTEQSTVIHLWDIETGNCKSTPTKDLENIKSVKFSPDNRILMIQNVEKTDSYSREKEVIHIWNVETGEQKVSITEELENVKSVVSSPDNRTLMIQSAKKSDSYYSNTKQQDIIQLWNVETGEYKTSITEELNNIKSVVFSPDSRFLIIGSENYYLFWDVESTEFLIDPCGTITGFAVSSDGSQLATGNNAGTILIWELSE